MKNQKRLEIFKQVLLLIAIAVFTECGVQKTDSTESGQRPNACRRIISFAPSITETIFALGLGDRLVGVTRYCNYPPEARKIPKVGGYTDPNFEMILGLKPDVVFSLDEHGPLTSFLKKNRIEFRSIRNENMDEILYSIHLIANSCGVGSRGDSIADAIRLELNNPQDSAANDRPLSVLVAAGRDNPGSGHISKLFAAGPRTFYTELLRACGARNACQDSLFVYPEISAEGIVRMQPDVIIDVMPSIASVSAEKAAHDWEELTMVKAVRSKSVFCLPGDYATIPGPRIVLLLRELRRIIKDASRIGR